MNHKAEIVISTTPGSAYHVIERLIGSTEPRLMPGTPITQEQLERLEREHRYKITLVRRKTP